MLRDARSTAMDSDSGGSMESCFALEEDEDEVRQRVIMGGAAGTSLAEAEERTRKRARTAANGLSQVTPKAKAKRVATLAFRLGGGSPLFGDGITDDMLVNIARFLPTARDLLCLKLINIRFAAKIIASAPSCGGGACDWPLFRQGEAVS